jgi:hypothetical protein
MLNCTYGTVLDETVEALMARNPDSADELRNEMITAYNSAITKLDFLPDTLWDAQAHVGATIRVNMSGHAQHVREVVGFQLHADDATQNGTRVPMAGSRRVDAQGRVVTCPVQYGATSGTCCFVETPQRMVDMTKYATKCLPAYAINDLDTLVAGVFAGAFDQNRFNPWPITIADIHVGRVAGPLGFVENYGPALTLQEFIEQITPEISDYILVQQAIGGNPPTDEQLGVSLADVVTVDAMFSFPVRPAWTHQLDASCVLALLQTFDDALDYDKLANQLSIVAIQYPAVVV